MKMIIDRSTPVNLQHLVNRVTKYSQLAEIDNPGRTTADSKQ